MKFAEQNISEQSTIGFTRNPMKSLMLLVLFVAMAVCSVMFSSSVFAQATVTNGVGEYIEFGKPTMVLKLDMGVPTSNASEAVSTDTAKKLSFRLIEDRTVRSWSQIWIQNLSINSPPDSLRKNTNDLIAMTRAIPTALKQGDLIEFERVAEDLTIMMLNRVEVSSFETPGFFEFLMSAFVGPIPPSSELKAALLAAGDLDISASSLFDTYNYSVDRAGQIAGIINSSSDDESDEVASASDDTPEDAASEVEAEESSESTEVAATETETTAEPEVAAVESPAEEEIESEPEPAPEPEFVEAEPEPEPVLITAESLLAIQNYQREMLSKIYKNLVYPNSAIRRDREGSLRLSVAVNRDGSLYKVDVVEEARFSSLNKAAIAAVDDAAPFSKLPDTVIDDQMVVEIPVQFRLQ